MWPCFQLCHGPHHCYIPFKVWPCFQLCHGPHHCYSNEYVLVAQVLVAQVCGRLSASAAPVAVASAAVHMARHGADWDAGSAGHTSGIRAAVLESRSDATSQHKLLLFPIRKSDLCGTPVLCGQHVGLDADILSSAHHMWERAIASLGLDWAQQPTFQPVEHNIDHDAALADVDEPSRQLLSDLFDRTGQSVSVLRMDAGPGSFGERVLRFGGGLEAWGVCGNQTDRARICKLLHALVLQDFEMLELAPGGLWTRLQAGTVHMADRFAHPWQELPVTQMDVVVAPVLALADAPPSSSAHDSRHAESSLPSPEQEEQAAPEQVEQEAAPEQEEQAAPWRTTQWMESSPEPEEQEEPAALKPAPRRPQANPKQASRVLPSSQSQSKRLKPGPEPAAEASPAAPVAGPPRPPRGPPPAFLSASSWSMESVETDEGVAVVETVTTRRFTPRRGTSGKGRGRDVEAQQALDDDAMNEWPATRARREQGSRLQANNDAEFQRWLAQRRAAGKGRGK